MAKSIEVGDFLVSVDGVKVEVIDYEYRVQPSGKKVKIYHIKFESGFITKSTPDNFRRGKMKDWGSPSVHGVGIIGNVPEGTKFRGNKIYMTWASMIGRCYDEVSRHGNPSYKDATVCERWITFANFLEDAEQIPNYQLWKEGWSEKKNPYELDKDILIGDSKVYSPETCMFVHKKWNAGHNSGTSEESKERIREEVLNDYKQRL